MPTSFWIAFCVAFVVTTGLVIVNMVVKLRRDAIKAERTSNIAAALLSLSKILRINYALCAELGMRPWPEMDRASKIDDQKQLRQRLLELYVESAIIPPLEVERWKSSPHLIREVDEWLENDSRRAF